MANNCAIQNADDKDKCKMYFRYLYVAFFKDIYIITFFLNKATIGLAWTSGSQLKQKEDYREFALYYHP